jgi:hypothetical protein
VGVFKDQEDYFYRQFTRKKEEDPGSWPVSKPREEHGEAQFTPNQSQKEEMTTIIKILFQRAPN